MRYIIVGKSPVSSFKELYHPFENDYLIGLDEGALRIINVGYKLDAAWGDFDTTTDLTEIKKHTKYLFKYPTMKNETDLELVLMHLNKANECIVYDCLGGRLDHELVNILLLKKYPELNLKFVDMLNEVSYYHHKGTYTFLQDDYNYIGIITLSKAVISITQGKYLLNHAIITSYDTYTTSNQFVDGKFIFTLEDGEVIIIKSK